VKETIVSCEESVSEVNEKLKAIKGLFVQEARKRKQFIMKAHGSLVPYFSSQMLSPLNKQGLSYERRVPFQVIRHQNELKIQDAFVKDSY